MRSSAGLDQQMAVIAGISTSMATVADEQSACSVVDHRQFHKKSRETARALEQMCNHYRLIAW